MSMKRRIHRAVAALAVASFVLAGVTSPATAATPAEIEQAIVDGLAWLEGQQNDTDGSWGSGPDIVGYTGLVCLKFEHRAHELGFADPTDAGYEYGQVVSDCLDYIISKANIVPNIETAADLYPSPGGNGDGIAFGGSRSATADVYNTGIAMMALAAHGTYRSTTIKELLAEARDWMSHAQNNSNCGDHQGGWRYVANQCTYSDNSVGGYASLGLGYAAAPQPVDRRPATKRRGIVLRTR